MELIFSCFTWALGMKLWLLGSKLCYPLLALSHLTSPAPSFHGTTYRQLEDQSRDFKICLIFSALQPRISVSF